MFAEERMKAEIVAEALEKSGEAIPETRDGQASSSSVQHASEVGLSGV
jgi:putative transposase